MAELTCFKAYDIRGEIGVEINENIAYRIGRAVAQHLKVKNLVIGFDARKTSCNFSNAAAQGVMDAGSNVLNIGMAGTEEMYWAVTEFGACAGIEVTASHNPINYNGMKIVKSGSRPLDDVEDFQVIRSLAEAQKWLNVKTIGETLNIAADARQKYVDQVLSFVCVEQLSPLKIVINSGNGAAGPTIDAIINSLTAKGATIEFIRVHHQPDSTFPNGIPNPLLPQNHPPTSDIVREVKADFGVAFDGDFDRCFLFGSDGEFIPGEYMVGLLASIFLDKEDGATIVHDPRVIWNTKDVVASKGGTAVQSKTGHAFIKKSMRECEAVYGGEISAHHYFRDFAYCDSGMIPWLLVAELVSTFGLSLSHLVRDRFLAYPSSGEINFRVDDAEAAIQRVVAAYRIDAISLDETDGVSLVFNGWRFNLRQSNTEPLVRLNVETNGRSQLINSKVDAIAELLGGVTT